MGWTEEELISNKWIEIDYLDLKGQIKTVFKYWEKNEPSHRKDKRMRDYINTEWKYIKNQANYIRDRYDGNHEDTLNDNLDNRIETFKIHYLKYYNFDGSLDVKVYKTDHPAS